MKLKQPVPASLFMAEPGDIGNMHMNSVLGWLMGHSPLGRAYHYLTGDDAINCPSHSVLFVTGKDGELCVGNVKNPIAVWQSLEDFIKQIQSGHITKLRIFRVEGSTLRQRAEAAKWWNDNVHNTPYDRIAYFRLSLKTIFGDWFPQAAGMTWAYWCTEGNKDSWKNGGKIDAYNNENPTPVTEIKRWIEGRLRLLT